MNRNVENDFLYNDLGHVLRLALNGQIDDLRLFLARMVRKYRSTLPELADSINGYLRTMPAQRALLRKGSLPSPLAGVPIDEDSSHSLLKQFFDSQEEITPFFNKSLQNKLNQLVLERRSMDTLKKRGLSPMTSAIFTGPPGVGKTMAARWIAAQLEIPLYVLDLTTVMSSLLGKTGANLRSVFDFAKENECVLFLDEIDSIAKKRSDNADIGELKRIVTIMLQEIENWPEQSLLLAATNYPELLDPALWRRFDMVIDFPLPGQEELEKTILFYAGDDKKLIKRWNTILKITLSGKSYSDIERFVKKIRRINALSPENINDVMREHISSNTNYTKEQKMEIIISLNQNNISNRAIADILSMHRDTVAKYLKEAGHEQN